MTWKMLATTSDTKFHQNDYNVDSVFFLGDEGPRTTALRLFVQPQ
jgi:hypothetical protein